MVKKGQGSQGALQGLVHGLGNPVLPERTGPLLNVGCSEILARRRPLEVKGNLPILFGNASNTNMWPNYYRLTHRMLPPLGYKKN
jgi:hypothetical protein